MASDSDWLARRHGNSWKNRGSIPFSLIFLAIGRSSVAKMSGEGSKEVDHHDSRHGARDGRKKGRKLDQK